MTLAIVVDGVDVTDRVRMTGGSQGGVAGFPASAWYGEVMTAGFQIDDPLGELEFDGWHVVTVEESACSKPRIFTGWLTGTRWHRGSYRTGAGRVIDCDIIDQNSLFGFEAFRSTAASIYPAQTDLQRIEQARASHAMAGTPIVDNGRVSSDDPVNLTGANFVSQLPGELFAATAGMAGKNFYAYWDDTADEISLHYAPLGDGPGASWGVSNVIADVDNDAVFFPDIDGELSRDPSAVFTGILFGYAGGRWVYFRNDTLIDELSPSDLSPVNFLRDLIYTTDRVGLTSTANTLAQQYLLDHAAEKQTLKFTVRVPASKVNLAHAGDIISVRFTHLRGFETDTDVAIVRRNVIPSPGRRDMYDITFECADFATDRGPGGGGGGETPAQPCAEPGLVQDGILDVLTSDTGFTVGATPSPGNTLVIAMCYRADGEATVPDGGFTDITGIVNAGGSQDFSVRGYYRQIQPGDTDTFPLTLGIFPLRIAYWELEGQLSVADFDTRAVLTGVASGTPVPFGEVTLSGSAAMVGACITYMNVTDTPTGVMQAPSTDDPGDAIGNSRTPVLAGFRSVSDGGTNIPMNGTWTFASGTMNGWVAFVVAMGGDCDDMPLPPHVVVPPREPAGDVDGSNTDFETGPFDDLSLRVLHDGTDQTAHVASYDGAAGTFTLDYAPSAGSTIRVWYTSRG